MTGRRFLVVEDEPNLGETLCERLIKSGAEAVWAKSVAEAKRALDEKSSGSLFDLVILDVGLPDGTGFDVAAHLRGTQNAPAILFLSAFADPEDRVHGLELGADDYVTKPFHLKELWLRIEGILKRRPSPAQPADGFQLGKAWVDFAAMNIGEAKPATQKECALLKLLVDRAGKVVSREEILEQVWGGAEPTTRTVDNFVMRLRRLIEEDPDQPKLLKSIRGIGYQLERTKG